MEQTQEQPEFRIKVPRNNEVLGFIEQRLGGSRMRVRCLDGKIRICRVPGRLKRKLWIREGDLLLIEPWEYDNEKGETKRKIAKLTNTKLQINSREGDIIIIGDNGLNIYLAKKMINAIGRDFNPEIALNLLEDDKDLEIIDISHFSRKTKNDLNRVRARLIGREGK